MLGGLCGRVEYATLLTCVIRHVYLMVCVHVCVCVFVHVYVYMCEQYIGRQQNYSRCHSMTWSGNGL